MDRAGWPTPQVPLIASTISHPKLPGTSLRTMTFFMFFVFIFYTAGKQYITLWYRVCMKEKKLTGWFLFDITHGKVLD